MRQQNSGIRGKESKIKEESEKSEKRSCVYSFF